MLHIKVLSAHDLPLVSNSIRKTIIFLFAGSGPYYFIAQEKSQEKTQNPFFSIEADIPFYISDAIILHLWSARLFSKKILIGKARLDFKKIIQENILDLTSPNEVPYEIGFEPGYNNKARISLLLSFRSQDYPLFSQVNPEKIPYNNLSFYFKYNPPLPYTISEPPVTAQLLHCYQSKDKTELNYTLYDENSDWSYIGGNTESNIVPGPTGPTPILSISKYNIPMYHSKHLFFFIIYNKSYNGLLSFVSNIDKFGTTGIYSLIGNCFSYKSLKPKKSGIFREFDIHVEPGKYYAVPAYFDVNPHIVNLDFSIQNFKPMLSDKRDTLVQDIISAIHTIPDYSKIKIEEMIPFPKYGTITLKNIYEKYQIPQSNKLTILNGGFSVHSTGKSTVTIYWEPSVCAIDKRTRQLVTLPQTVMDTKFKSFFGPKMVANSQITHITTLDLNQADPNYVIIYILGTHDPDLTCVQDIPHCVILDAESEKIFFRTPLRIFESGYRNLLMYKFEKIEDEWQITSIQRPFTTKKNAIADFIYSLDSKNEIPEMDTLPDFDFPEEDEIGKKINEKKEMEENLI